MAEVAPPVDFIDREEATSLWEAFQSLHYGQEQLRTELLEGQETLFTEVRGLRRLLEASMSFPAAPNAPVRPAGGAVTKRSAGVTNNGHQGDSGFTSRLSSGLEHFSEQVVHGIESITSAGASMFVEGGSESSARDAQSDAQRRGRDRRSVTFAPRDSRVTLHREPRLAGGAGDGHLNGEHNLRAGPGSSRNLNGIPHGGAASPAIASAAAKGALVPVRERLSANSGAPRGRTAARASVGDPTAAFVSSVAKSSVGGTESSPLVGTAGIARASSAQQSDAVRTRTGGATGSALVSPTLPLPRGNWPSESPPRIDAGVQDVGNDQGRTETEEPSFQEDTRPAPDSGAVDSDRQVGTAGYSEESF